jgi:hypothetical protein
VERRLLVIANREILVAANLAPVDQEVAGAVHRLQAHLLLVAFHEKHVLSIVLPVPGRLPQRSVEHDRRLDLLVAGRDQHVPHVACENVVENRAFAQPEGRARRPLVEHEESEILPELPVVALLRFLETLKMGFQLRLAGKRRPVDPLHRLVVRIALPVRVGRRQQLERLEPA